MKTFSWLLFILGWVMLSSAASAQLQWPMLKHEQTAPIGARQVVVTFPFTYPSMETSKGIENPSDGRTITITSVKPDCGCTTIALSKTTYTPGESGTITAIFNLGSRTGEQAKRITVRMDDPDQPVVTLTMVVTIPDVIKIIPKFVWWKAEETRTAKTIDIVIPPSAEGDLPLQIVNARSLSDVVAVKLVSMEDSRHYRLEVTPVANRVGRANLRLETNHMLAEDQPLLFWASARVLSP